MKPQLTFGKRVLMTLTEILRLFPKSFCVNTGACDTAHKTVSLTEIDHVH